MRVTAGNLIDAVVGPNGSAVANDSTIVGAPRTNDTSTADSSDRTPDGYTHTRQLPDMLLSMRRGTGAMSVIRHHLFPGTGGNRWEQVT
jgi:hypothetical protein